MIAPNHAPGTILPHFHAYEALTLRGRSPGRLHALREDGRLATQPLPYGHSALVSSTHAVFIYILIARILIDKFGLSMTARILLDCHGLAK
jgi:hypothetical protein